MQALEKMLEDAFKSLPQMPESARKTLATFMPWITLAGGVSALVAAFYAFQLLSAVSPYVNGIYSGYGYIAPVTGFGALGFVAWLSLGLLAAQAVLFLIAFPALRSFKKGGWNILFWVALVNVAYDVINNLFNGYINLGGLVMSLIGAAIGLYLLFQIRSSYTPAGAAMPSTTKTEPTTTSKPTEKK